MKKIGDVVKVNKGEKIPDLNIDMTGWRGRIIEITKDISGSKLYIVAWDSKTLQNMGIKIIKRLDKEKIDWEKDFFFRDSIKKSKPRDTEKDVKKTVTEIKDKIKNYKSNQKK